jgi:hypothetical protein
MNDNCCKAITFAGSINSSKIQTTSHVAVNTPLYLVFILDKLIVSFLLLLQLTITFPDENIKPLVDIVNLKFVNPIGINVTVYLNLASNLMKKFIMQIMLYVPRACLDLE